jgi:glutaryl-CoA dehydrogenase
MLSTRIIRHGQRACVRAFGSGTKFEKFNFEDAFDLNGQLTDEERMISEAARHFATEKLMPRIKDAYNKEHFDINIMKEFGEMGFLGCTIKDYGLPGVSSTAYGKLAIFF